MQKRSIVFRICGIKPQKIMFILQKSDGESTYNNIFFEIKKGLFQMEKESFRDELKALIAI